MSAVTVLAEPIMRPRGWRHVDAWCAEELRPCGELGGLQWRYWSRQFSIGGAPPDLSDCRIAQPKPWRIVVWEPLITKAPGPHLAQAYCCYIQTVIFYGGPRYVIWPYPKVYRGARDRLQLNSGPTFLEWDQIETRLGWEDQLVYRDEVFQVGGGRVLWANASGERRRWWMRRSLRRKREGER